MRWSWLLWVGALVACEGSQGTASPRGGAGAGAAKSKKVAAPRTVAVVTPREFPYPRTLEIHGTLEAANQVRIAARVEGPVVAASVDLGDRVRKNQSLARIAPEDFQSRITQLDAEAAQARDDLGRLEQLARSEMATAQSVEQARTKVAVTKAQRSLIARQLRDTTVRAPFEGAIAARHVDVGAYVRVGEPLFDLVSTDDLRLVLEIPEAHAAEVVSGETVRVSSEATRSAALNAEIVRIAPAVTPQTRTVRVEAAVPSDNPVLRAGMFVIATIELGMVPDAVRLPRTAVFTVLGRERVVVVRDGRAEPRDVELLAEVQGDAVVRGVRPDETIVAERGDTLSPGAAVHPVPRSETTRARSDDRPAGRDPG